MVKKKEDRLTADERKIVDSIDYEKIAEDAAREVASRHDEILASTTESAIRKTKKSYGKMRRWGIYAFIIGIFFLFTGVVTLGFSAVIFFIVGGICFLYLSYGCFLSRHQIKR